MCQSRAPLAVSVWDKVMVNAVDKAIRDANLGLSPTIEGTTLRIRIPELNEQRRKEMVKVAHKYTEEARVAVRHVRKDGLDILKRLLKEHAMSEDDEKRHETEVQKATDDWFATSMPCRAIPETPGGVVETSATVRRAVPVRLSRD